MSRYTVKQKTGGAVLSLIVLGCLILVAGGGIAILIAVMGGSAASICGSSDNSGSTDTTLSKGTDKFQAVAQITAGDNRLTAAMLVGSYLESGWNATSVSKDGAFGWYQIQDPGVVHPNITVDQALDPVYAVNYMLPAYKKAMNTVDPMLWITNPEMATEEVAYAAERPKLTYYQSQGGVFRVHTAYTVTLAKMTEIGVSTDFTSTVSDSSQNVATQAAATSQSCNSYKNTSFAASGSGAQAVLAAAQSQLGVPYVFGGGDLNGPTHGGFDCSGFTRYAFNKAGVSLPRTAADQWHATQQYQVAVGQEQPGDLVFFVTVGSFTDPGHVGIVLDPGKKLMMAEPKTGDVAKIQSYAWGSIVGFTRPYPSATAPSANG